ncbi:hypothetical protein HanIR_Chr07g0312901 [Helianthus annuus]|nr:hypothetical protein HanIR_Chr07g0312901 [Helianthus annuus]
MYDYPIMYRMAANKGSWVAENYNKKGEVTVWDWQWKNKPTTGEACVEFMQLLALLRYMANLKLYYTVS